MERQIVSRVFILVAIAVVSVLGLIQVGSSIFSGSDNPAQASVVPEVAQKEGVKLISTTSDYEVRGVINSVEQHRILKMSINKDRRAITIYRGYGRQVVKSISLPNTKASYNQFVRALEISGFTTVNNKAQYDSPDGVCASGFTRTYDLLNGPETISSLWQSTCGNNQGTSAANANEIHNLFRAQFPNYDRFTLSLNIR